MKREAASAAAEDATARKKKAATRARTGPSAALTPAEAASRAGKDAKARKKAANRARTRPRAEVETTGLSARILEALSEAEAARLSALRDAFERESRAAYELKVQWSAQSQVAYSARDALAAYRLELERAVMQDGRVSRDDDVDDEEGEGDGDKRDRRRAAAASAAAAAPKGSAFEFDGLLTADAGGPAASSSHASSQPDDGSNVSNAVVVLVRTTGPVNLGQIARVCNNLAVRDVRIVEPQCETNCSDSRKFAVHSKRLLVGMPVFATLAEAVADCGLVIGTSGRQHGSNAWRGLYTPEQVPDLLRERPAERYAVVFGNEAAGLNDAELSQCHTYVRIPTRGYSSLNLGHAVAVVMYTISRAHVPAGERARAADPEGDRIRDQMAASVAEVTRLANYWSGTLRRFGWTKHLEVRKPAASYRMERALVQKLLGQVRAINEHAFGTAEMGMMKTGDAPCPEADPAERDAQEALRRVREARVRRK